MTPETLKGHLELLLLAVIQPEPAHGYAIAEALRGRSKGAFDLPEGTLYPALHRLERALGERHCRDRHVVDEAREHLADAAEDGVRRAPPSSWTGAWKAA